jgi:transglycosylase-like protein with SLT domain
MRALAVVAAAVLASSAAAARTVTSPLLVDHAILEAALRRDLGMRDGETLELVGTPGDCTWAVLDDVAFGAEHGALRLNATGTAVAGFRLIWFCFSPLTWQGQLAMTLRPIVGRDWQLRIEPLDVEAKNADGTPSTVGGGALALARGRLEDRLAAFHFDLGPPIDETKALVRASASGDRAAAVLAALDTLRPLETTVDDEGVRVRVAIDVPEGEEPAPGAEPPLDDAAVARWQERLDRWDAFLVFAVKTLGATSTDPGVRNELLAILLDGRRELTETLRQGPVPGVDPVRALFLSSWDRLRVETRRAIQAGTLGERALRFVTFLTAADALAAVDQAGPGLGLEISADGLRRLARVLDPERPGDPVAVSDAPDPELQKLFGIAEPGAPESTPPPTSTTAPAPTTTLPLTWLFAPRAAEAAEAELATIGRRLDRWIPAEGELGAYRATVEQLLVAVTAHREPRLDRGYVPIYRHLVPAVAWQESCWRQFVERNGKVTFLLSATGDVGMMQVNRRVWRGFFELRKLEWDAVYNAAAGAEILAQLLTRFGEKEGRAALENAARATYSAYNGGPGAYARYRSPKASALGRAIDADFFEKYRTVAAGTAGERVLCM